MARLPLNKYRYVRHTPTWLVRGLYGIGLVSWTLVVLGFSRLVGVDPFFTWFVIPIIGIFSAYHFLSFGINLCYRQFDLARHFARVRCFWNTFREPSVDIYLPICGEDIAVLENTWHHVARIPYQNKRVYVLDDSPRNTKEHRRLARAHGFAYFERPNKGENKKAGNLKYAYERTRGDFIVIFDADFAPHHDFLKETLPYMRDPNVGIVQTPQYFDTSYGAYRRSPLPARPPTKRSSSTALSK